MSIAETPPVSQRHLPPRLACARLRSVTPKKSKPGSDGTGRDGTGRAVPRKPMSLKKLAEHLALSPATVSLVINRSTVADSIPQETKDRIFAAARKFKYRPNFFARSLRTQRNRQLWGPMSFVRRLPAM